MKKIFKKYKNYFIPGAIFLFLLGVIALNQNPIVKQHSYEELTGVKMKVPVFEKNTVTLSGATILFNEEESKKDFTIEQYEKILKTDDLRLLPIKVTQNTSGKKLFFLVAFLKEGNNWNQKQSVLFGLDIENIKLQLMQNVVRISFDMKNKQGEMVSQEKFFKAEKGVFSEYFPRIDGGSMGLDIIRSTWKWKQTTYGTGTVVTPKKDVFTLKMNEYGKFLSITDCNQLNGTFVVDGKGNATFGEMTSTKMACEGSQEDEFSKMLLDAKSFVQTGATLEFGLKTNSGSMMFEKYVDTATLPKTTQTATGTTSTGTTTTPKK